MWILLSRPDTGCMSLHLHLHLTIMTHMANLITYYQPRTIYLLIIIGNKMMNWLLIIIIHYTGEKYWSPSLWKIISIIISTIYLIITEHYPDTLLSWCYGNPMGRRYHSTKTENQFVAIPHLMKFYVSDPCDLYGGSVQFKSMCYLVLREVDCISEGVESLPAVVLPQSVLVWSLSENDHFSHVSHTALFGFEQMGDSR